jgi:hypothetical protein
MERLNRLIASKRLLQQNLPIAEVALIRSPRRHGRTLAATVIRAARLAAILLPLARGLQHADKGLARP